MFEPKAFDQIFNEMRDRTPPRISDFAEGSVARTLYETFAFELASLYEQMHQVYLSAFVDTATGSQLDLVVAVLGIKRGEPDFATGEVTFERDLGLNEPLTIPIGFLVTTSEDMQETVKKAYQTIETRTMSETESRVTVKVQAIERGEALVTEANTVRVMPQPLPGIKAITNERAIEFTGKHRETDEELRDRAKITLLATSGANVTAIETALMSLPGVKEARVRENFYYARGKVTLSLSRTKSRSTNGGIEIPAKTELIFQTGNKRFLTQEVVQLTNGSSQSVQVESVIRGAAGQVTDASQDWQNLQYRASPSAPEITITVQNTEPLILKDFGVIEVFVDGIDFDKADQVKRLQSKIEEVRAAGIYVFLKPAQLVEVDGVFLLELKPAKQLSTAERLSLETRLQAALIAYIGRQRMGQPLLISQLIQTLLADQAVNDLVNFELIIERTATGAVEKINPDSNKRLEAEFMEKFVPRQIWVATEIKPLIVDIQMKVANLNAPPVPDPQNPQSSLFDTRADQIQDALRRYFNPDRRLSDQPSVQKIQEIQKQEIRKRVCQALGVAEPTEEQQQAMVETITLTPRFWQPQMIRDTGLAESDPEDVDVIKVGLAEQAQLGNVLLYSSELELFGAIRLSLPLQTSAGDRQRIENQVRKRLQLYVDQLQPGQNLVLDQFIESAREIESVLAVNWKPEDFSIRRLEGGSFTAVQNAIQPETHLLQVAEFEKVILADEFVIAGEVNPVTVTLSQMKVRASIIGAILPGTNREQLRAALLLALRASLETFCQELPQPAIGQSLKYRDLVNQVLPELMHRSCLNLPWSSIRALLAQPNSLSPESLGTNAPPLDVSLLSGLNNSAIDKLTDLTNALLKSAEFTIQDLRLNDQTGDVAVRIMDVALLTELLPNQVTLVLDLPDVNLTPSAGRTSEAIDSGNA